MKKFFAQVYAAVTGRNPPWAPKALVVDQMLESRPLPTGMAEFEVWADRIVSGTLLPVEPGDLKFAIANMILHLGPQESHKPDAFFIHSLRKTAANQIAVAKREEYHAKAKARLAPEEAVKTLELEKSAAEAKARAESAGLKLVPKV